MGRFQDDKIRWIINKGQPFVGIWGGIPRRLKGPKGPDDFVEGSKVLSFESISIGFDISIDPLVI